MPCKGCKGCADNTHSQCPVLAKEKTLFLQKSAKERTNASTYLRWPIVRILPTCKLILKNEGCIREHCRHGHDFHEVRRQVEDMSISAFVQRGAATSNGSEF